MKPKNWIVGWLIVVCLGLVILGLSVYTVDPFMHYRQPDTEHYFYHLDNERSQNNGIIRHFVYDALITGTSMTQNFKTSEMDELFGCNSIKVPSAGGTYKEINEQIKWATEANPELKIVVRGLDMDMFLDDKNRIREDMGSYPTYLYDDNLWNDVEYLWNRDVIWDRVLPMLKHKNNEAYPPGITSFDEYSRWMDWEDLGNFGVGTVCPDGISEIPMGAPVHLSNAEREMITENVMQNVTELAKEHPEITFYYFIPPYSVIWWQDKVASGTVNKQIEAEGVIIELILECDNIRLFSFNNRLDITSDLNNYKDKAHYGDWINSLMLQLMKEGKYQLSRENYKTYLDEELNNYLYFDYVGLNHQEDYEDDDLAAEKIKQQEW